MKRPVHIPSLVLMIIGAVFSLLLPIVSYPCCIISLVMSAKVSGEYNVKPVIIVDIIALAVALTNSVLGVILYYQS